MGSETTRLAREARSGDRSAFEGLVRRCVSLVYGIAWDRTRNPHDAEDVAQEVFLEAHLSIAKLENPESVRGWIAGITCHRAIDWIRRKRPAERLDQVAEPADTEGEMPDGRLLANEASDATGKASLLVRDVIDALPPILRDVVKLRYQQELPYKSIAQALGISVSLVGERLFRARQLLEERLGALER